MTGWAEAVARTQKQNVRRNIATLQQELKLATKNTEITKHESMDWVLGEGKQVKGCICESENDRPRS
jgi:hypothetical protein